MSSTPLIRRIPRRCSNCFAFVPVVVGAALVKPRPNKITAMRSARAKKQYAVPPDPMNEQGGNRAINIQYRS